MARTVTLAVGRCLPFKRAGASASVGEPRGASHQALELGASTRPRTCSACCSCACCSLRLSTLIVAAVAATLSVVNHALDALVWVPIRLDPNVTGCRQASFRFVDISAQRLTLRHDPMLVLALVNYLVTLLGRAVPRWAVALAALASHAGETPLPTHVRNLTIRDARAARLRHTRAGFALIRLPAAGTAIRTAGSSAGLGAAAQSELEAEIRRLYPRARRMVWTHRPLRAGGWAALLNTPQLGIKSPLNPPTLSPLYMHGPLERLEPAFAGRAKRSYSANRTVRQLSSGDYPGLSSGGLTAPGWSLPHDRLLGSAGEDMPAQLQVLIGLIVPVGGSQSVGCPRLPLAVMHGRTFRKRQARPLWQQMGIGLWARHDTGTAVVHHPRQRWWYFSSHEPGEALLFTLYTRGRFFATPYAAFGRPGCPQDAQSTTLEMRVSLFW